MSKIDTVLTDDDVAALRSEHGWAKETIRAIEHAILSKLSAKTEALPVGYVYSIAGEKTKSAAIDHSVPNGTPLYTAPLPQQESQLLVAAEKAETALAKSVLALRAVVRKSRLDALVENGALAAAELAERDAEELRAAIAASKGSAS